MSMKNLSRRNRTVLYIVTVMLILSMVISAIVSFSPTAQTVDSSQQAVPAPLVATPATGR
ncbi:MAG: hypothetical protein M1140_16930 [Chloroflexi bacterium]|nr:hypothetical protein [Chloroflexota bacterium]